MMTASYKITHICLELVRHDSRHDSYFSNRHKPQVEHLHKNLCCSQRAKTGISVMWIRGE